jgi:hypothetical protein
LLPFRLYLWRNLQPQLEILLIGKSKVTEEGAKALQKALPKLRFTEQT